MQFIATDLADVIRIVPEVHRDDRGCLLETWQAKVFREAGIDASFVQDNASESLQGTLRGLHYQVQQPQGKLVRVVAGEVFDVAVDIRRSSPNFGRWVGETLSDENKHQLWIPPGFAHGFMVLSDIAVFEYKCTNYYAPVHERSIRWDDQKIAIEWPELEGQTPVLSNKDANAPSLEEAEVFA